MKESSLIQHLRKNLDVMILNVCDKALEVGYKGRRSINEMRLSHPARRLYLLIERYKESFHVVHAEMKYQHLSYVHVNTDVWMV